MSDTRPFLATVTSVTRSLQSALPAVPSATATSPWSPKPEVAAPVASTVDVEAVRAEARESGREAGLRETAELRTRLAALVEELEAARRAVAAPAADLIADAATAIVTAWSLASDRRLLFAPIVRSWLAKDHGAATVRVHPDDRDAMCAAIGDAALTVEPDPELAPGDIRIASATFELAHCWETRLRELREAIAAAIGSP